MSDLYHLAYFSRAAVGGEREVVERELRAILAAAHRKNPSLGVTGALLYSGGYFCQVIEGPLEALEDLYETIQLDGRHTECTVLFFEPLDSRGFERWDMAFAGIDDELRFPIEEIKASHDQLAMKDAGHDIVAVLLQLVTQHQQALPG
jgi:hypothetical protein